MKKRSYLIAAGCTVVLYALSACSDHAANDTAQAGNPETMSVAEARRYFERVAAPTRAGSEEGTLTLGTYMPDWSLATVSAGEVLSSTDVPVRGEFRYFRYRIDEYGEPRFTPIYHKLVVVKDPRSGSMSGYIRYYLPEPDYAVGRTADYFDGLLDGGPKGDFTGLAVYALPDGFPVLAARYVGGVCREEVFLGDRTRTLEENAARLGEMLGGLYIVYSLEGPATRIVETDDSPLQGPDIEVVLIVDRRPLDGVTDDFSDEKFRELFDSMNRPNGGSRGEAADGGGSSGGGNNNSDDDNDEDNADADSVALADNRYHGNRKIWIASDSRKQVEPLLDKLLADCMGGKIIGSIGTNVTIRTGFIGSSEMVPTAYIFNGSTIWVDFAINMGSKLNDITLLEELFHIHQCRGKTYTEYQSMKLNNEVEAKLCWYMYRLKIGNTTGLERYLGEPEGKKVFDELRRCILSEEIGTDWFNDAYRDAGEALRSIGGAYANATRYPFSENAMQVDVLLDMIADCLEYKNN